MVKPEIHEQIEQYLLGKMSSGEQRAFEERLSNDSALAQETNLHRQIIEAMRTQKQVDAFESTLSAIEKKMDERSEGNAVPRLLKIAMFTAAMLLLALAAWWFFGKKTSPPSPESLFIAHFNMPDAIAGEPGQHRALRNKTGSEESSATTTPRTDEERWSAAQARYAAREFAGALAEIRQIAALDSAGIWSNKTTFYTGLLHLQLGDPEKALSFFEKVEFEYTEDSEWYSALALLALHRTAEAKLLFEKMMREGHPRKEEAKAIDASLR